MTYRVGNITVPRAQDLVGRHVRLLASKTTRAGVVLAAGTQLEIIHVRNGRLQLGTLDGARHIVSRMLGSEVELVATPVKT